MNRSRLCIYAKDVSLITGKGQRFSQKLLRNIRFLLNKEPHQYITVTEFADYTGIALNLITTVCK